ncbi:hypothetical protein EGW08_008750 [Elysia chlorotica]|uniref:Uncharacterized protein n=1 Tax=Elysia chlorotica TaxID=188477 RepID=A0A3S0ZQK6_ELYCH|nr:hypothetical protein EGW08_008750 [Elysia chlorotica]
MELGRDRTGAFPAKSKGSTLGPLPPILASFHLHLPPCSIFSSGPGLSMSSSQDKSGRCSHACPPSSPVQTRRVQCTVYQHGGSVTQSDPPLADLRQNTPGTRPCQAPRSLGLSSPAPALPQLCPSSAPALPQLCQSTVSRLHSTGLALGPSTWALLNFLDRGGALSGSVHSALALMAQSVEDWAYDNQDSTPRPLVQRSLRQESWYPRPVSRVTAPKIVRDPDMVITAARLTCGGQATSAAIVFCGTCV